MGSSLSANMVNSFFCHYEQDCLENCSFDSKPLLYRRYVNNTFLVFRKKNAVKPFFNYSNSKHPNIKFTKEHKNKNKLSFLNAEVEKIHHGSSSKSLKSIFRKSFYRTWHEFS